MKTLTCGSTKQKTVDSLDERLRAVCPPAVKDVLLNMPFDNYRRVQELRLRKGQPLSVLLDEHACFLTPGGQVTFNASMAYKATKSDIDCLFQNITRFSVYALEEELRNGYVTILGGHRIGFTGEAVLVNGRLKNLKNISCINIRISREIKGCADPVLPWLMDKEKNIIFHTLIISPPNCGKTTLLRDIVRQLSNGIPRMDFQGVNVGVVDERSEIAACYLGIPQKDVGIRTDVLDKCPKAEGMYLLVRSMSPQVIASDEIGRPEDASALQEVLNAGIKVVTSVHGLDEEEIQRRPTLKDIVALRLFERFVVLGRSEGAGTLESIVDGQTGRYLFRRKPFIQTAGGCKQQGDSSIPVLKSK